MDTSAAVKNTIARVDRALAGALDKWSGLRVAATAALGGVDPATVRGAIGSIDRTGIAPWRARGLAFTRAVSQADLDAWTTQGEKLLAQVKSIGDDSINAQIDRIVVDTVAASADDVKKAAKETANVLGSLAQFWGQWGRWIIGGAIVIAAVLVVVKLSRGAKALASVVA